MTEKEVKIWLNRAYRIDEEIERERKEIQRLDDVIHTVSAISYDKPNVQSSAPRSAGFEDRVVKLQEIKDRVSDRIVKKEEIKEEITKTINMLDDHYQRKVVILRHFNYLDWYEIEYEMGYSRMQCFRIYNQAIKIIRNIILSKDVTQWYYVTHCYCYLWCNSNEEV